MPNWCNNTYEISGPEADIITLEKTLVEVKKNGHIRNDFDGEESLWLGHIYTFLGKSDDEIKEGKTCPCRGSLTCFGRKGNTLSLEAMTAWALCMIL